MADPKYADIIAELNKDKVLHPYASAQVVQTLAEKANTNKPYTFATLPLNAENGDIAYVTDRDDGTLVPAAALHNFTGSGAALTEIDTTITAVAVDDSGNDISVQFAGDSLGAVVVTTEIDGAFTKYTVHYQTAVATVAAIEAAFNIAAAGVAIAAGGTGAHVPVAATDDVPMTALAGGIGLVGAAVHYDAASRCWRFASGARVL